VEGTDLIRKGLKEVILAVAGDGRRQAEGRHFQQRGPRSGITPSNWQGIKGGGAVPPTARSPSDKISADFGSFEEFATQFKGGRLSHQFGSGWAWLVPDGRHPEDHQRPPTPTLPSPMVRRALLTMDVWSTP